MIFLNYEIIDCIDAGTEFCPCHLAEAGECILCSQCQGKHFCDCVNWKGVCIYQELKNNGNVAKKPRQTYICNVEKLEKYNEELICIKFKAPHKLTLDLVYPGSFVFVRTDENFYFDIPISIMEADVDSDIISMLVEIRGIKTKKLLSMDEKCTITIRGPYWNGAFGLKNINSMKNKNCLVLARGIGMAPMIPVLRKLKNENNKVSLVIDKEPYNDIPVKDLIEKYEPNYEEMNLLNQGKLSEEAKELILRKIKDENIELIHCAGADILTYTLLDFLDSTGNRNVKVSCCNNAKMCCGEGVCGSCTARFSGHKVKRLCKVQADPRNIFEGRRFI